MRVLPRITVDGHAAELICTLPFTGRSLLVRYASGGCQWVDPAAVEIRPADPITGPITGAEAEAAERVAYQCALLRGIRTLERGARGTPAPGGRA